MHLKVWVCRLCVHVCECVYLSLSLSVCVFVHVCKDGYVCSCVCLCSVRFGWVCKCVRVFISLCSFVCGMCAARVGRGEKEMLSDYLFDMCVTLYTFQ